MPQGLWMCNQSFRISTEHPKENMSRPIITVDATVKTSPRSPCTCSPTGSSSSEPLAGWTELLQQFALISSRQHYK